MTEDLHLDYATRDYDGFRQLLISVIDRQDTAWTERAAADLGTMIVELLAYELDRLAYAGDRVAEEAFLATARRRESARRHAALGDHVLDRGNATRGLQWFRLADGQTLTLPARTRVATPADPRDRGAMRVCAETLDEVHLDARRNRFALSRSAPAGTRVLRLILHDEQDLRRLGFTAGMRLIVGRPLDESPFQLALGEEVQIAKVMAHGLELEHPLRNTWPGGNEGAWLLGNVVEVRRGSTSDWTPVGRGGKAFGEIAPERFLQARMEIVRRLRAEVENARASWIGRSELKQRWTETCRVVTQLRRELQRIDLSAYAVRGPEQIEEIKALDRQLTGAAAAFRGVLAAVGRDIPDELEATERVQVPRQTIELPMPETEQPVLWMDPDPDHPARSETLAVAVGIAGTWTRWTEQPDLLRSAPDDHHYVVEIDGNSRITLRFGDGVTGAMLPAGSQVMARWVSGDESGDDIRAGALGEPSEARSPVIVSTSNPLPTTGGRDPESIGDGLAARVAQGLEQPPIPVTAEDYEIRLRKQAGVAESRVTAAHGIIDVVIRPGAETSAGRILDDTRASLERDRLAGTTVVVRLARVLPIDIGLVVDVHPDVSADDLRYRVQRKLVEAFGDTQPEVLGRPRERAEVYRIVEKTPGVLWSQVVVFDVALRTSPGVLEVIVPAADQIVRCAGIVDRPAEGAVTIWAARRFSVQLAVSYDTLETRPQLAAIPGLVLALLSGPESLPVQRGWTTITKQNLDDALAGVSGAGYQVEARKIIVGGREVAEVELGARELPILDTAIVFDEGPRKRP